MEIIYVGFITRMWGHSHVGLFYRIQIKLSGIPLPRCNTEIEHLYLRVFIVISTTHFYVIHVSLSDQVNSRTPNDLFPEMTGKLMHAVTIVLFTKSSPTFKVLLNFRILTVNRYNSQYQGVYL